MNKNEDGNGRTTMVGRSLSKPTAGKNKTLALTEDRRTEIMNNNVKESTLKVLVSGAVSIDMGQKIEAFRHRFSPPMTMSEALRRLLDDGLKANGAGTEPESGSDPEPQPPQAA